GEVLGRRVIERQARIRGEQGIDGGPVAGGLGTAEAPVPEFGDDYRAHPDVGRVGRPELRRKGRPGLAEGGNPDVGVEQVCHSMSTGGGNSPCGARTNVSSSTEPNKSKYPGGQPRPAGPFGWTMTTTSNSVSGRPRGTRKVRVPSGLVRSLILIGGIVRGQKGIPIKIGGTADHVHLLLTWRQEPALAAFLRELKAGS